ncbi:MAG: redoxin domain-containing protein [Armatimonadetes bacterium]|nr:redoxin domain-containing protein [Armatimonadota bacterium]
MVEPSKILWLVCAGVSAVGAVVASSQQAPIRVGPKVVDAAESGIGRLVRGVSGDTISGSTFSLETAPEAKGYVVAMTDLTCPVTQKFAPTLAALEDRFSDQGIVFIFVNSSSADERDDIEAAVRIHGFDGPYIWDPKGRIAAELGVRTTTEVFLLDAAKTLVYRGAVDDQYGLGYQNDAPRNTYLADAIDAMLAGERPAVEATTAPGCLLMVDAPKIERRVTYYDQVARILQRNCVTCHRDGGVAPFALDTYAKADNSKGMIKFVVNNGTMPPWFAAPAEDGHSPWANDRTLSARDKADLMTWIDGGTPEGDRDDAPKPLVFHNKWEIGEPDAVFSIPEVVDVKATGQMPYKYFRVETGFEEDKWIDALEIKPTHGEVVHHVLVFVMATDPKTGRPTLSLDARLGFFAGYVPGTNSIEFPDGFAKLLPAGATLMFQVHYTPNGVATKDQTELALRFAEEPTEHEIRVHGLANFRFEIPPGAPKHSDSNSVTLPRDIMVTGFLPHMHLRGKAFRYEVEYPDGRTEVLLDVPRYDFNWQLVYRYREAKLLPKGSVITATGWFDNSANNPANPDPTATVRWGDQTDEEMLLGYVEFYVPGLKPGQKFEIGR